MAKASLTELLKRQDSTLDTDRATALVICKNVYVDGELCTDPKQKFPADSTVEIIFPKYVSRGGFKLERALELFDFPVKGLVFLDAGSSTGGFTDCLLQHGASHVHCVDVGYNLLDFSIRSNPAVSVHEKTNIMELENLDPRPDAAVADLSFRSIGGAATRILGLTKTRRMTALIKPQFEVPRGTEGFDGVVRDNGLLRQTLESVYECLNNEGVGVFDVCISPVRGHKGNREFLALLGDLSQKALSGPDFIEKALAGEC